MLTYPRISPPRRPPSLSVVGLAIIHLALFSSHAYSQGSLSDIERLKTTIENHRERLVSGKAQGEGKFVTKFPESLDEQHFNFIVMFDFLSGNYLFDLRADVPPGREEEQPYRGLERTHSIAARSESKVMAYSNFNDHPELWLDHREAEFPRQYPIQAAFFDPRALGLQIGPDMLPIYDLPEALSKIFTEELKHVKVTSPKEGIIVHEHMLGDSPVFRRIRIDEDRGYVITYAEYGFIRRGGGEGAPERLVRGRADIDWREENDVFVPVRYHAEWTRTTSATNEQIQKGSPRRIQVEQQVDMELDWLLVNELPEGRVFDYRAFGLPKGTFVYDKRFDPPKMVERIDFSTASPTARLKMSGGTLWILGVSIAVFAICIVAYAKRRLAFRRDRSAETDRKGLAS